MKALLICPGERPLVSRLTRTHPPALFPMFGKCLIEYWLEQLALQGATHVSVLACGRQEAVGGLVANGARWGIKAEVISVPAELSPSAARHEYRAGDDSGWLSPPHDVTLLDHFPGLPEHPLFETHAEWFTALQEFLPRAAGANRIGVRQFKPDVWVGLRARIAPGARLRPPCWIGENVRIGNDSVIGPLAVIEDRSVIDAHCDISSSVVGPQTFVGKCVELREAFAWGRTLLNWRTGSVVSVPDPFLLCPLGSSALETKPGGWFSRLQLPFISSANPPR